MAASAEQLLAAHACGFELLSKGLPYTEIENMLSVGIETVRNYYRNNYQKL